MPLIETVTYPDCINPEEVKEACDYIRFLNRSTGLVRTGIGAGRQDVNVSCRGGSRVEIKGVAHTKWIPELTHNEAFRQWALLKIRDKLLNKNKNHKNWKISSVKLNNKIFKVKNGLLKEALLNNYTVLAVNLPGFKGILSHFTQPGKIFANEIEDRLKVIACLEKPFMFHSEELEPADFIYDEVHALLKSNDEDAQIVFWGPEEDIKTALETIEERCLMAFEGVPNETRKSFEDGTTIFERVLPGADRMYPDTDSAPIPLPDELIKKLSENLPDDIINRYHQLKKWNIPEDTYTYIFSRNHFQLIEKIIQTLKINPVFVGTFFGHTLKFVEGHYTAAESFNYNIIFAMFRYLQQQNIEIELAKYMIPVLYEHPKMDFDSVLDSLNFKKIEKNLIVSLIPLLKKKFVKNVRKDAPENEKNWIMGELRKKAIGNIELNKLAEHITK